MEIEQRQSLQNERQVMDFFNQNGFAHKKLDQDRSGRRPDFLFLKKSGNYKFVCEVKSIFSAGTDREGNQASIFYRSSSVVTGLDPLKKIYEKLGVAREQWSDLIAFDRSYEQIPYIVLLFDHAFFGDSELNLLEKNLRDEYACISAVGTFVFDYKFLEKFRKLTIEEMKKYITLNEGIGREQKIQLKLILNETARVPFKRQHLLDQIYV